MSTPSRARVMVDRLLRIRTGRHPHEVLVLIATVLLGTAGMFIPQDISPGIAAAFPNSWEIVYWAVAASFAATALVGVFRRKIDGLLIERAGLTGLAAAFGAYVIAVLGDSGLSGLASVALPTALCAANVWRCFQIRTDLVLLRAYLIEHPGEQVR